MAYEKPCRECGASIHYASKAAYKYGIKADTACKPCVTTLRFARERLTFQGKKFGKLTALEPVGFNKNSQVLWKCLCECGTEKIVAGTALGYNKHGKPKTTNCGCSRYKPKPPFKWIMNQYRGTAKHKGLVFHLTDAQFEVLLSTDCSYCGVAPSATISEYSRRKRKSADVSDFRWNGIDRIDSSEGYTTANTVACCTTCNRMKLDHSHEKFLAAVEAIYAHQHRNHPLHLVGRTA